MEYQDKMEVGGMSCPCPGQTIIPRGNFFNDQYFEEARQTLQGLMSQMQQSQCGQNTMPQGRIDYLLAELNAWQQSGQNLDAAMSSVQHNGLFNTIFRFEADNLKMLIDVKGFQPFNLKLNVNDEVVEVIATKEEASASNSPTTPGQNCIGYMSRTITRKYIFPQKLVKECVQCSLSTDGVLFICAPWKRC